MSAYSRDDEERIRMQAQVRAWTNAGLLDATRGAALETELKTDLRRTNLMLRLVLAFFTAIIVAAAAGFVIVAFGIRNDASLSTWLATAAVLSIVAAERAVTDARLYRFGVEEALIAMAVLLGSLSVMLAVGALQTPAQRYQSFTMMWTLAFAAAACLGVWARFGLTYAGVASIALAALVPFTLSLEAWIERMLSVVVVIAAFLLARWHHRRHGDDYPGDGSAVLQAAAWLGVYVVINLQLTFQIIGLSNTSVPSWFYWTTFGAIWMMPAIGLWLALSEKDRPLIAANVLLAIATLATNKSYLGWPRHSWDPMILGALLIGTALLIRRWLASGAGEQRFGFTASRLLDSDRDVVAALGNVSVAWQPHGAPPPERPEAGFGGGRSGGGGAQGSF